MANKSSERLTRKVTIRLTKTDGDLLDRTAKMLGVRPSDALRMGLDAVNTAVKTFEIV